MLDTLVKSVASIMAPVAQGVVETVGGPNISSVVGKLKEHFSGNDILQQAIEKSYEKALDTVEIALIGPKFYEKASTKNFASQFWQQTMTPFLQRSNWNREEFIKYCVADVELLKKRKFFNLNNFPSLTIAEEVAKYASQEEHVIINLQDHAHSEFASALKEVTTAPHSIAHLVEFRNIIVQSASLHFGQLIQKDEFLFRSFYMANQAGLKNQLQTLTEQIQKAQQQRDEETLLLLTKQQTWAIDIQSKIQNGLKHVNQNITKLFSRNHEQTLEQLGTITKSLDILKQQGQETIERLTTIEEKITTGHNAILEELKKLQSEIQQIRTSQGTSLQKNDKSFFATPQKDVTTKEIKPKDSIPFLEESIPCSKTEENLAKPVISFSKRNLKENTVSLNTPKEEVANSKPIISFSKQDTPQQKKNVPKKVNSKPVISFSKPDMKQEIDDKSNIAVPKEEVLPSSKPVVTFSKNIPSIKQQLNPEVESKTTEQKDPQKPVFSFKPHNQNRSK